MSDISDKTICGVWVTSPNTVCLSLQGENNSRVETEHTFAPFAWAADIDPNHVSNIEKLSGSGSINQLIQFKSLDQFYDFSKEYGRSSSTEIIRPLEHQWLLQNQQRLFRNMHFNNLRRCQVDIETGCSVRGGFSNAKRAGDRVLAIGVRFHGSDQCLVLEEESDEAERKLLEAFNDTIQDLDPDTIEGHNIFKFDLEYLRIRCRRYKVPCNWGRFGQEASFRPSRLKVAERWIDFPRCDIPGRTVFDTYLMIQLYDVTKRELPGYSLKVAAVYFGISNTDDGSRTYIQGSEIHDAYKTSRDEFIAYLKDDLRETEGVANVLLPTYFAQVQNFPMIFQETVLRGSSQKLELMLLEKYYEAKESLPQPSKVGRFEGGYAKSFHTGVFENVLHFDVASLYPSLLQILNRNPKQDSLGVFLPLLKTLKDYRILYKKKAQQTTEPDLKQEYEARQASFKILINSFYGYLGFEGARFSDGILAAEITSRGRDLLKRLISEFEALGCPVLEADTDGLYVSAGKYFENPEALLKKVGKDIAEGIDLEYDGSYTRMFCYKAKNYALYDGETVIVRGSGLKSRGMEPFLRELTDCLINFLLGVSDTKPQSLVEELKVKIESGSIAIERLAKTENLSQNPELYSKNVQEGKKPRRASLEVALSKGNMRMGDRVTYFITVGEKARMPDWQTARPIESYDPKTLPYDPKYYVKKLNDWVKRYSVFWEDSSNPSQGELL